MKLISIVSSKLLIDAFCTHKRDGDSVYIADCTTHSRSLGLVLDFVIILDTVIA